MFSISFFACFFRKKWVKTGIEFAIPSFLFRLGLKEEKNEDVRVFSSLFFPLIEEIEEGKDREKGTDFVLFFIILFFLRKRNFRRGMSGKMVPELFLFSSIMKIGRREKEKIRVHSHLFSCYFPFWERGNWGRRREEKEAFCSS